MSMSRRYHFLRLTIHHRLLRSEGQQFNSWACVLKSQLVVHFETSCVWLVNTHQCNNNIGSHSRRVESQEINPTSSFWNLLIKPQNITNMLTVRRGKHEYIYRVIFQQLPIHNALAKPPPHTPKSQESLSNTKPGRNRKYDRLPYYFDRPCNNGPPNNNSDSTNCDSITTIVSPHNNSKNTKRNRKQKDPWNLLPHKRSRADPPSSS